MKQEITTWYDRDPQNLADTLRRIAKTGTIVAVIPEEYAHYTGKQAISRALIIWIERGVEYPM